MIAPEPVLEPRGTPISVYQRLKALSSLGHQLDLVTYHLGEDIDIPGVEIHRIPKFPFIKKVKIGPSMAKLFMDVFVFLKALAMLMTHRYEVIHSHEEAAFFGIFLARLFGTLHIYDMHSSLPNQLRSFEFWGERFFVIPFKALERMVLRHSDAVIAIDAELFDRVQQISPAVAK
ncbi:MAG TPA: glycosyltransferase, partial [Promineifilum sp.]